jgi:hypothetical protein
MQSPQTAAQDSSAAGQKPTREKPIDLVGYWKVVEATYRRKPLPKAIGDVYWFKQDGEVEVWQRKSWSRMQYELDTSKTPPILSSTFFTRRFSTGGPVRWEGDRLRWRDVEEPEKYPTFDSKPMGHWNESLLERITEEEAKPLIEKLERERLGRKGEASEDER